MSAATYTGPTDFDVDVICLLFLYSLYPPLLLSAMTGHRRLRRPSSARHCCFISFPAPFVFSLFRRLRRPSSARHCCFISLLALFVFFSISPTCLQISLFH